MKYLINSLKKEVKEVTQDIIRNYVGLWEFTTLSEEEFVYDSLQNESFYDIMKNTNIHILHLGTEADPIWANISDIESPNEEEMENITDKESSDLIQSTSSERERKD